MADKRDKKTGRFLKGHTPPKRGKGRFKLMDKELRKREPEIVEAAFKLALSGKYPQAMNFILNRMYGRLPANNFQLKGKDLEALSKRLLASVGKVEQMS